MIGEPKINSQIRLLYRPLKLVAFNGISINFGDQTPLAVLLFEFQRVKLTHPKRRLARAAIGLAPWHFTFGATNTRNKSFARAILLGVAPGKNCAHFLHCRESSVAPNGPLGWIFRS